VDNSLRGVVDSLIRDSLCYAIATLLGSLRL
jgi:hypothetical protein